MKILAVSDIHGNETVTEWINVLSEYHDADYVFVLGDITDFGPDDLVDKILGPIKKDVYAIPGNCDPPSIMNRLNRFATDLHGKAVSLDGFHIAGLGGSNPTIFDTPFEIEENMIYDMLQPISENGMILMVHAPPYGVNDTIPSGAHVGSTSIRRIVEEFSPRLVLSGHIHEDYGVRTEGNTVFVNPGPAKNHMYAFIELDGGSVSAELFDAHKTLKKV